MKRKADVQYLVILQIVFFFFSLFGICTKLAAQYPFFSLLFYVFYGLSLVSLSAYAIVWQMILKKVPLVTAYFNKAVTLLWGMLWGKCFFDEDITFFKIVGTVIVCIGIVFVVTDEGAE